MHDRSVSFGYRISQLHRHIARFIRGTHGPMGIEQGQVAFIAELMHSEAVTQDELSCRLHIDKGATARQLARLEKAGLITRTVNEHNRRQNLVSLSDTMRKHRKEFLAPLTLLSETLVTGFSTEERAMALSLLDRMITNLQNTLECKDE